MSRFLSNTALRIRNMRAADFRVSLLWSEELNRGFQLMLEGVGRLPAPLLNMSVIQDVSRASRCYNLISQGARIDTEALENAGFKGRARTGITKNPTKVGSQVLVDHIHLPNSRLGSLSYERTQKCAEHAFWSSAVRVDISPIEVAK